MPDNGRTLALRIGDLLFLLGGAAVCLFLFVDAAPRMRFQYDEADYMVAARMGLRENYLETSSLSFPAYVRTGLRALSNQIDRTDLSESVRLRNDVSFYRHYHGPLYFHWLALVSRLTTEEAHVRAAGLVFHLLAFVTIFVGLIWLLGPEGRTAAWIASSAYLFSVGNIRTALGVSTHQMYAWVAILTLFVIARFLITGRTRYLLAAVGGATVSLSILEYGVLLFVVLAFCGWRLRRRLLAVNPELATRGLAAKLIGLFLGICALLWPAGLFKLSMLKAYLAMPFLAVMRKDSFGKASLGDIWSSRLGGSPLEYAILFACLAAGVYALTRFRSRPELAPFVLYAGLILLIALKSDTERYMSSAPPALYVVGAVILADWWRRRGPSRWTPAAMTAGFLLLLASAVRALPARDASTAPSASDTVGFVSGQRDRLRSILVPGSCVPAIHYYVPEVVVRSYRPEAGSENVLARIARAPVDALFVRQAADADLGSGVAQRFRTERIIGPDDDDPTCGRFVVYFLGRPPGEASWPP